VTGAGTTLDLAPRAPRRDVAVIVASVALHVVAAIGVGRVRASQDAPAPGPTQVTLEVAPPPPAEAPPRPETPPPPAHERRVAVRAPRRAVAAPAPQAVPAPAAEEPVDLTGVTLTDPNGAAWASAAGNGASRTGPVGPVGRPPPARPVSGTGTGDADVVPLADLRQPPRPPELQTALEQQYPADARRDGTVGQAQVRARVRPDGNLDRIRVVVASAPGFGDACRRVLAGSRWTPPLGRDGEPCATEIRYVCRFEITR
jgi:TonB family protein